MGDFSKSTDKLYYAANAAVRENAKQVAAHNATYESKRSWPPEFDMIFMRGLPDILSVNRNAYLDSIDRLTSKEERAEELRRLQVRLGLGPATTFGSDDLD